MRIIWQDDQGIDNKQELSAPLPSPIPASINNEPERDDSMLDEYGEGLGDSEDA